MKKAILFLFVIYPFLFWGQGLEGGSKTFGAIEGTINVSMYGGATYYLPVDIPRGVNGMQPDLGIVYNSQSGNSLLGYGWNINGISTITRTGSTLFHNGKMSAADFSEDDCFLLDGQRLIFVESSGNNYEYKTENDEFSKIVIIKENGYFSKCEARLENGNIIKYGYTNDSKLIADDGNNVIKWMISSIADRNGNTISYSYETSGTDSDIYIKKIFYTSNTQANLSPQYTVSFTYLNNRFDDYHYYIAGNKVNCDRILNRIDLSYNENTLMSYAFSYDGNTNRMYNLLTGITYSRSDGYSLDPIVIQWNTDNSDIHNNALTSQEISTSILDNFSFVGDFNGDGYSDLLTVPYKPLNGYSSDVTANIYLNNRSGEFNTAPNSTLTLPRYLDWIHVLDINGDGYDDIVAQTLTSTTRDDNNITYNTGFVIYYSQSGNGFSNEYSTNLDGRYFVRTGDFLGECRSSLVLLKLYGVNDFDDYYIVFGYPQIIHYDNVCSLITTNVEILDGGAIVTDDFNGDGKTEIVFFNGDYSTFYSFHKQGNSYTIATNEIAFVNNSSSSYFSGDFNNDGKADIFFNGVKNGVSGKFVALSTGLEFGDWIRVSGTTIDNMVLPNMQTYKHSLGNVSPNTSYGVNFSDIDGDGKTDIIFYNGNNRPVFFRNFGITNTTTNTGSFKIEYQANSNNIQFKNQYFTIGNFLGKDHVSFIAVDPQNPALTSDDKVKVFNLPSTNERFSVSSITDGFGITTDIEYDYLMPGQSDFYVFTNRQYVNNVKPCPMPMLAMKSYTSHIGSDSYNTRFKYGNVLLHRTGRGFVNFENIEKANYINNTFVKLEKSFFETTTMGANAVALPQCDSVFIIRGENSILSETNAYTFQNIACSRQSNSSGLRNIVRPAMISQKTKRFSPDTPGQILSVEITDYIYNYNPNSGTYSDSYGCTMIEKGINGTDCSNATSCNYQNNTQISFKTNDYSTWIINRKSEEVSVTEYASKPSITKKTKYDYSTTNPYLVVQKTAIPSSLETNPLTVRYNYQYDVCGNLTLETVSAPYGIQNELPLVTSYSYNNYRNIASKTIDPNGLSYQEQYTYDDYDRIISYTGSNGLTTTYQFNDPFNNHVLKTEPGNIISSESMAWASGTPLSPSGAVYYKHSSSANGSNIRSFYDAKGNEIRTITWNHNADPVIVDMYYDKRQLLIQQSYPYISGDTPQWTEYEYDDFGRLVSTTYPDNKSVTIYYNGLTATTTTSAGNSTRSAEQTTNYLGWVTSNTDASNVVVSYDYYSDGQLASMTTSGGNVIVEMEYDDAGNRIALNDSDYGVILSFYDAFGRLKRQINPRYHRISYSYDVLGRITQKLVYGESTTLYQYNETTNKGTLSAITHPGQTLYYTYDQYDRLVLTKDVRTDTVYSTVFAYDNYSRLLSKEYPSGYKVFYEYYPNGAKKNIKDVNGKTLWHTDDINACGQLIQATTGNGAVTTNTYDVATNRMTASATSNGIQSFAYTFDGFGNLTSRIDSIGVLKTESFTYDNLDRLTGISLNNVSSTIVYDSYGRMTSKQKEGNTVFSQATFSSDKPHATIGVISDMNTFPDEQTISYNALDKVERIVQNSKTAQFAYDHDAQRIRMTVTDTLTQRTRTKDYTGSCEFVNDNGTKSVYTYLTGPYGVFAVVIGNGTTEEVNYIYKDHLGSWTTITDSVCGIVERRSFDAWGNLRDPLTWTGEPSRLPKFDRGFTGHEHLYNFGLINMNGRMYDPLMSSFLSPDNYMQDPTSQQGFNRYAYCMYNPLKYIDPSGEQYYGWDPSLAYRMEQEAKAIVRNAWHQCYDSSMASHYMTIAMTNCLFSHGQDTYGNGSGNHGSPGGSDKRVICEAHQSFNDSQRDNITSDRSKCVFGSLGSTCDIWEGALNTQQWIDKAQEYGIEMLDTENMPDFIRNAGYEYEEIAIYQICDAMNEGYVVNVWCTLTNETLSYYNLNGTSHNVNISDCIMYSDGVISISFSDFESPGFMVPYTSNINQPNRVFNYSTYRNPNGDYILKGIRFFMIKPNWP